MISSSNLNSLQPYLKISIVVERSSWVPKKSGKTTPTLCICSSGTNSHFVAVPSNARFLSGHPPQSSWLGCTANTIKRNLLWMRLKDCRWSFTWRRMQSSSQWPPSIALPKACYSMNFVIFSRQSIRKIRQDCHWPRGYAHRLREIRMQGFSGKCFECLQYLHLMNQ